MNYELIMLVSLFPLQIVRAVWKAVTVSCVCTALSERHLVVMMGPASFVLMRIGPVNIALLIMGPVTFVLIIVIVIPASVVMIPAPFVIVIGPASMGV